MLFLARPRLPQPDAPTPSSAATISPASPGISRGWPSCRSAKAWSSSSAALICRWARRWPWPGWWPRAACRSASRCPWRSLVGLLIGVVMGWLNGTLVARVRLPPFIVTLGTMSIARGVAYGLTKGWSVTNLPESFLRLGQSDVGIGPGRCPLPFLITLGVALLVTAVAEPHGDRERHLRHEQRRAGAARLRRQCRPAEGGRLHLVRAAGGHRRPDDRRRDWGWRRRPRPSATRLMWSRPR